MSVEIKQKKLKLHGKKLYFIQNLIYWPKYVKIHGIYLGAVVQNMLHNREYDIRLRKNKYTNIVKNRQWTIKTEKL